MVRLYIAIAATVVGCSLTPTASAEDEKKVASFKEALQFVRQTQFGWGNMPGVDMEPQVYYRILGLQHRLNYENPPEDASKWLKVVKSPEENTYTKICAAQFVAGTSEKARSFLEKKLNSRNVHHRYSAAEAVRIFVGGDPKKTWGIDLLLKHIANGSLDGNTASGVLYRDKNSDHFATAPVSSICWTLGAMKCERAAPTLIGILERHPGMKNAVYALGEISDPKAIPILMKTLKNPSGNVEREVAALGKLKAKEAVPILIDRLGKPEKFGSVKITLEALLAIGDKQAIKPIRDYIATNPSKAMTAAANRVLVQFDSDDPTGELLALLNNKAEEPERSELVFALARYPDDTRVLQRLSTMARKSDSAYMRRAAVYQLGQISTAESLLVLASLLDTSFPSNLTAEWGWKQIPDDFTKYFRDQSHRILREKTGKDFPAESAPWSEYLKTL